MSDDKYGAPGAAAVGGADYNGVEDSFRRLTMTNKPPIPEACSGCVAEKNAEQLRINCVWLVERIDEIHTALCPDHIGTWQDRAVAAVEAAKAVSHNAPHAKPSVAAIQSRIKSAMGTWNVCYTNPTSFDAGFVSGLCAALRIIDGEDVAGQIIKDYNYKADKE